MCFVYYNKKVTKSQDESDILCSAQSDIMPYGIVIFLPLAKVVLYSPLKLAKRISLAKQI